MVNIALKEWAVICDLLLEGKLAMLLRKGGIFEPAGPGRFELEHPHFALFPSWAHQKPEMLKPDVRPRVQILDEPDEVAMPGTASVVKIWRISSRERFDLLDDLHPWAPAQIDMRFNYKPHNPLYLMALRVMKLPTPVVVANRPTYAGCKSWVPLEEVDAVSEEGATPALSDAALDAVVARIDGAMNA